MVTHRYKLTDRQANIAWLISERLSDYEISLYLEIDPKILKMEMKRMYYLVGAENREEVAKRIFPHKGN